MFHCYTVENRIQKSFLCISDIFQELEGSAYTQSEVRVGPDLGMIDDEIRGGDGRHFAPLCLFLLRCLKVTVNDQCLH